MNELPDDAVVEIFTYLPKPEVILNVRFVCWRWYSLSYSAKLWLTVDLTKETDPVKKRALIANLKRIQDVVNVLKVAPCVLTSIFNHYIWQLQSLREIHLTPIYKSEPSLLTEREIRYPRLERIVLASMTDYEILLYTFPDLQVELCNSNSSKKSQLVVHLTLPSSIITKRSRMTQANDKLYISDESSFIW